MRKKVLLMGRSGSGKSSMRSIVFSNYVAKDTRRLGATIDIEHSHVRFLGNLVLNLWDCGGQEAFMENYLSAQRDHIFRNVQVLIYVFDVESREFERDLVTFRNCLEATVANSPQARVFCLIHKMDLVQEDLRDLVFEERKAILLETSKDLETTCLATSIWDETLFKAWSAIVYTLIPNTPTLESHLREFAKAAEAAEVILFERTTFLVISSYSSESNPATDAHRFEKISNIVKQFKLSCSKMQAQFTTFELRGGNFSAFIVPYTEDTYILVVIADPEIESAVTLMNIQSARRFIEASKSASDGIQLQP
ncbi:RagA/B GTPase Gtr1 [Schizosaccharomyces pombe]|uniref:GTP-binding protein gtr1 n=2 Tax=cellular organisms TaxID=131567 RepID=RAGAB_SCHPO|nr:putative Gtr1/RagA G protein Gtr1 [Schizosaccharomyces pombe]O74824.1 RecName: Full=GTP-binding protein gtr1 [Schizosaccharomyces pombe 972h-]CAA21283.1 Gtr1/RagA G protein Gtr1 (predicted) [Schizosaccharomyces pombe]|eukprot:NP_595414.1 putative Gtr1/RagA G protein Gtr1 [Schizosaccharomyces pombe]